MADKPKKDMRTMLGTRRVISPDELTMTYVNVKANVFGRLLADLLDKYPDTDVSTIRLEERPHPILGDHRPGLECRITARQGKL